MDNAAPLACLSCSVLQCDCAVKVAWLKGAGLNQYQQGEGPETLEQSMLRSLGSAPETTSRSTNYQALLNHYVTWLSGRRFFCRCLRQLVKSCFIYSDRLPATCASIFFYCHFSIKVGNRLI